MPDQFNEEKPRELSALRPEPMPTVLVGSGATVLSAVGVFVFYMHEKAEYLDRSKTLTAESSTLLRNIDFINDFDDSFNKPGSHLVLFGSPNAQDITAHSTTEELAENVRFNNAYSSLQGSGWVKELMASMQDPAQHETTEQLIKANHDTLTHQWTAVSDQISDLDPDDVTTAGIEALGIGILITAVVTGVTHAIRRRRYFKKLVDDFKVEIEEVTALETQYGKKYDTGS